MENKLQIFNHTEFGSIRTINEDGTTLFCGNDVAKSLGYVNPRKALIDHCRGVTKRDTPTESGTQPLNFIPEGDIYRLIVRSKLPAAEKFERWIFDDVVPSVVNTGGYVLPDAELITQVATATAAAIMQQLLPLLRTTKPQEDDFDTEYIQLQEVRRRRNRASSVISQLDAGLRQEVEEMLCSHKFSYTDVVQMLREQGIKISTSSVCNYAKKHGIFPV